MKKVTVIIPCYNCAESVSDILCDMEKQTIGIENLEIILVDDASTDDTLQRLCIWEEKYPESVLVIHCEENGKQGAARNIGLQYASAPYIGFVDADDRIENKMFEMLYQVAEETKSEVVICRSVKEEKFVPVEENTLKLQEVQEIASEEERNFLLESQWNAAVWNKLYRRDFLTEHEIYFVPGKFYEDIFFTELVKLSVRKYCVIDNALYHHIFYKESSSHSVSDELRAFDFLEVHMDLIEEVRHRGVYGRYESHFVKKFFVAYLAFMSDYERCVGRLSSDMRDIIIDGIKALFPNCRNLPFIKAMMQGEQEHWKRYIAYLC